MKFFKKSTMKKALLTCFAIFATTLCAALGVNMLKPATAKADAISSTVFQTDGTSVRVFKWNGTGYEETDKQGIRFHVETGANYEIATGTPLLNTAETNDINGSYKMADGYKSYTLVLPTRLMGGSADLTMDLDKVLKIDTTQYWFDDGEGNWESVAYIYKIPVASYTEEFTYRGVIVSVDAEGNETPVKWTPMKTGILSGVAKQAYNDTIDPNTNYWDSAELDEYAAEEILKFVPTIEVNYVDNAGNILGSETVLWGDTLGQADKEKTYYDETNHELIDVTKPLANAVSGSMSLNSTSVSTFLFTGVEYTKTADEKPKGFNVFATLPTENFGNAVDLEPSTVDMVTGAGNKLNATSVFVGVTGSGADAVSQLQISFDYTNNISNGTTLTILKSSHFYNQGTLYQLEKDYEFIYNNNQWELPLGYITLGDIKSIVNFTETNSQNEVEQNIRINFKKDFLINGGATFDSGSVTIKREADGTTDTITDAYYYWNQGDAMILEIPGEKGGNVWGETNKDVLTIAAGTRLVQNNGFYVFQDEIKATFNGGDDWKFTFTEHEIDASAFTAAYTRQSGDDIYIDVHTAEAWADHYVKVVCNDGTLTYHNTDNVTTVDPNEIFYHGENGNKILRIHLDSYSVTGDWVTIPANTQFWVGDQIYTLTEAVTSYFVDTGSNGMTWVTNPVINEVRKSNITSMGWHQGNVRYTTDEAWSSAANNRVIVDDTYIDEEGVVVTGSNYSGFYYYGGENRILELQGANFSEAGGSVTIKEGVILWLFDNAGSTYTGAYKLTEDLVIAVSGEAGSTMYKDTEVANVSKSDIAHIYNDGPHGGEIRFVLNSMKVPSMYGVATIENGTATLDGEATTGAFVYGGDGTSGYSGNSIIAFTGDGFNGKPFQADAVGEVVTITAGTKIWLSNGNGYVTFTDALNYVYNGSAYVDADVERTVTFNNNGAAAIKVNDAEVSSYTVNQGKRVFFTVEIPEGYQMADVTNATLWDANTNTYMTNYLFDDVTVTVNCVKPIVINQSSIQTLIPYYNAIDATDFEGFRLQLKATDEINAVATNYKGTFEGTIEMKVGTTIAPTVYYYYGDSNRFLAIGCDISGLQAGDYLTIKAGSTFVYGAAIFYVESDISIITITANFDSSVHGLNLNYASRNDNGTMTSGKPKTVLKGEEVTVTYGWVEGYSQYTHNIDSVTFNGVEQGVGGTYTTAFEECTTINVTTSLKSYTATVNATGATVSGVTNGQTVKYGDKLTLSVSANTGYENAEISSVTGATNNGDGTYTVTGNVTVTATATAKSFTATVNATGATVSGVTNGQTVTYGQTLTLSATANTGYENATLSVTGATDNGNGTYTVTGDVTVTASATAETYTATVNATGANVSGVTNGQDITYGVGYSFTVSAESGYLLTSVKINGVEQGTSGSYSFTASGATSIDVTAKKAYTVTWSNPTGATINVTVNGNAISSGKEVAEGTSISVTATANTGYKNAKISSVSGAKDNGDGTYTVTDNVTITASATIKTYSLTVTTENATVTGVSNGQTITHGQTYTFTVQAATDYTLKSVTINDEEKGTGGSYSFTADRDTTIVAKADSCIIEGTLITLADGTQRAVEDLTGEELLLVWNLETGKYDAAPIVFVDSDERMEYKVVTLYFSNGAEVGVVSEHGFFNITLGKYVYLNALNATEYMGHEFVTEGSIEDNTWNTVTLTDVVIETKVVKVYSPVTFSHLCYYVEGVLSMPGGIEGLFNIFEVDIETMSYNAEKMAQDIETYGLFTYEDFGGMIPMEAYEAFNGAWLKVAMGKGLIDWAKIEAYAARYIPLM